MPTRDEPEAFSRILIDQALRESDWDLLDPRQVRFESTGRDGRADYILLGKTGPLCVLEAKRLDLDPYDAKDQARGYDIVDAVRDPEGPFLCLPKIFDIRSDITTQALADKGWAVLVNEQEENYKIQDLERKIFTPERNRVMCEAFLKNAQRDPSGEIGKSIIFAVNQNHATNITKILNAIQPNLAVTITSRIPDASSIAKDFRDGKLPSCERPNPGAEIA